MTTTGRGQGRQGGGRRRWRHRLLLRLLAVYPPFLGAGIRVHRLDGDAPGFEVRMKLTWWNRNYVGTHFGGSLYAMCDPFYMLLLIERLGPGYLVWDKAAAIRFRRPGRGTVRARFILPDERVAEIRRAADAGETVEPVLGVDVVGDDGEVVAAVEKTLWVRRRAAAPPSALPARPG